MLTFSVNKDIHEMVSSSSIADARPTTDKGREWWSEVWIKALEGRTDEEVNIDAYGFACERNTKMAISSKESPLLTVEEIDSGLRGVADTVASYIDLNIDVIVESSEVKTLVGEFLEYHDYFLIEEGVNLWKVLKLARQANVKMIDKLRDLISRHGIGDMIESVLKNRECLDVLEEAMA